jgi:DNA-binding Lrp family transcriptional regulator
MPPIAYVLVDAKYGECDEVLGSVKKVSGVEEAYKIKKGVYGIIAKISEGSDEKLSKSVENVRNIKGVKCTLTEIADDS